MTVGGAVADEDLIPCGFCCVLLLGLWSNSLGFIGFLVLEIGGFGFRISVHEDISH